MRKTISFSTTYFCDNGCSAIIYLKNKHWNHLQLKGDLQVALSKSKPAFERLVMMKQQQKSH